MLRSSISAIAIALLLSAPAHALDIRDTKDCQAAQTVQDGADELGFDTLLGEAMDGDYTNFVEWKKNRLQPALQSFEQRFPLSPAEAISLPNYAGFVDTFSFRTEQMANQFHQMKRHSEGSKRYEQAQSTARVHLNAMKDTMAKFKADCVL